MDVREGLDRLVGLSSEDSELNIDMVDPRALRKLYMFPKSGTIFTGFRISNSCWAFEEDVDYPGTYADTKGSERIVIANDGETLWTMIRGVEFSGNDFDALSAVAGTSTECVDSFTLNHGELCDCLFTVEIPVPIVAGGSEFRGMLFVTLDLGSPTSNGGISHERLQLTLAYADKRLVSSGDSGWFEGELLDIHGRLPEAVFMKACINCLYSDYSPYGHGLFGCMMCFRNLKDEYLRVNSKETFWVVHGRQERMVQETYLCPDFSRRLPGTGYRG